MREWVLAYLLLNPSDCLPERSVSSTDLLKYLVRVSGGADIAKKHLSILLDFGDNKAGQVHVRGTVKLSRHFELLT